MAERAGAVRKATKDVIPAQITTEDGPPPPGTASSRRARAATKSAQGTARASVAKTAPAKNVPKAPGTKAASPRPPVPALRIRRCRYEGSKGVLHGAERTTATAVPKIAEATASSQQVSAASARRTAVAASPGTTLSQSVEAQAAAETTTASSAAEGVTMEQLSDGDNAAVSTEATAMPAGSPAPAEARRGSPEDGRRR